VVLLVVQVTTVQQAPLVHQQVKAMLVVEAMLMVAQIHTLAAVVVAQVV
jgi:hypothetical protein